MTTNKPKLLFVIPEELLTRIDDFRFNNRINSRSEAVRQLIEAGLMASNPSKPKSKPKK
jgi:metal-responsive CopG/Arc/MetJ family transcriptional regulator